MEKDKSTITEQILNLTLEILYLLTGEDYILVKKPGGQTLHNRLQVVEGMCRTWGNVLLTPPHSLPPQEDNELKILDLTNKVIKLLTGEVPIRCQDVAVYFSMEEWEYIEGHKDLYRDAMMEDPLHMVIPDGPICSNSPLHNVGSDLVHEDDISMDTDSGTESLKIHNPGDMEKIFIGTITEKTSGCENGNLSVEDPTQYSCTRIKEEPCDVSWAGEDLNMAVQLQSVQIKEEPASYDGENLTNANIYITTNHTQHHSEPASCNGENLTDPKIYTPTDHTQHHSEPANLTNANIYTPTNHTQHHTYPPILGDPVSGDGQNLTQPNIYTSTIPSLYLSIQDIGKLASWDRGHLTDPNIYRSTDHIQQHLSHTVGQQASSNNDLSYSNLHRQFVPIRMKKDPVIREDHKLTKHQRYPLRRSTNTLINRREPASCNGRKRKNLRNTFKEPPTASAVSGQPPTPDDTEKNNGSSVYSVRQSANTMEILYHCPSCHKGFYSNLDLARHQVIHTVDKLFICSSCGKSFTEMSFLIKHQVIHTDLKLCVCQVCGECFYSETSLAKHQKSHSLPMYCTTCGKCFFDKTELEIHKRKHMGKRPFACHVCGKPFICRSVLNKHMLTHPLAEQSK